MKKFFSSAAGKLTRSWHLLVFLLGFMGTLQRVLTDLAVERLSAAVDRREAPLRLRLGALALLTLALYFTVRQEVIGLVGLGVLILREVVDHAARVGQPIPQDAVALACAGLFVLLLLASVPTHQRATLRLDVTRPA